MYKVIATEKKKNIFALAVGFAGSLFCLWLVVLFNRNILASLPLIFRMPAAVISYWLIAAVPLVLMLVFKDRLADYGFSKEKIPRQLLTGLAVGISMSLVLTLIPHLTGLGEYVDGGNRYTQVWQYVYDFFYYIIAVGAVEEFIFRGFIYRKINAIFNKDYIALIGSSLLFGIFHLFAGNIVQLFTTALIGAFFCLCRMKIKGCTTLSLIIAHGVYDALIVVWGNCFA